LQYLWLVYYVQSRNLNSRGSSVSIVTSLRAGRPPFDFRQRQRSVCKSQCPDRLWDPASLLSSGTGGLFPWG